MDKSFSKQQLREEIQRQRDRIHYLDTKLECKEQVISVLMHVCIEIGKETSHRSGQEDCPSHG